MNLRALVVAASVTFGGAALAVQPAEAATIAPGSQIDIVGVVDVADSNFQPGGRLDFEGDGIVVIATGTFAGLVGATASLFDLTFTPPETVWEVSGFSFTSTGYMAFDNVFPGRAFEATGILSHPDYESIPGILALSTQSTGLDQLRASFSSSTVAIPLPASVMMLLGALAGLGLVSRGRGKSAA